MSDEWNSVRKSFYVLMFISSEFYSLLIAHRSLLLLPLIAHRSSLITSSSTHRSSLFTFSLIAHRSSLSTILEAHPHRQLKRTRPARPEHLRRPVGRLPERRSVDEIAAMAGKVRGVVQVEHLANERKTPALFNHELPTQPQIE